MKKLLPQLVLFLFPLCVISQTNVRGWYADGQVFVVWNFEMPVEESFEVYASPFIFTNTSEATLIGRPIHLEYLGFSLKDNLSDHTATFRVPDGNGGMYQLGQDEGLFVFTPHQSGALYFAVTKVGESNISAGENITAAAVPFTYDPQGDPVECHLQRTFPSPFTSGYICFAYILWADGRQNHLDGRPDFPIMANALKNGMPGLFLVSAPVTLDTTMLFPLSVWLHGGGGTARQSLAGSRAEVDISPDEGILVAHDDKMYGYRGLTPPHPDQPTWHFGYRKNYDPFSADTIIPADTVINYTQRRYLWVDQWLARNFPIDTHRINIHGHSMGSAGALALAKCYPQHYGSATLFNTGCTGPDSISNTIFIFGNKADNLPTNLENIKYEAVRFYDLWDLYSNCSHERDLPLIRHWHGKNDNNGVMHWGPAVIENYYICDSTATGLQHFWSERPHGMDMAPAFNDHWIQGIPETMQTVQDNVDYAEARYRSNRSYPAFFNHRLDPANNDPGSGLIGINNGDGDNWGTWGGYHRWVIISDSPDKWEIIAWLEGNAVFPNDVSPHDSLTSDIAIRRPQSFKPLKGQEIKWSVEGPSGELLQNGTLTVRDDELVTIPQIKIYNENIRRVRIIISDLSLSAKDVFSKNEVLITPNPASGIIHLQNDWKEASIIDVNGMQLKHIDCTSQASIDVSELPGGIYFMVVRMTVGRKVIGKFVKI